MTSHLLSEDVMCLAASHSGCHTLLTMVDYEQKKHILSQPLLPGIWSQS